MKLGNSPNRICIINSCYFALVIGFVLCFTVFTGCGTGPDAKSPESEIAYEIFKDKIVLIADNSHMNPYGYDNVVKIVDEWCKISGIGKKAGILNLVLERDDSLCSAVNYYIHTGDINRVLENYLFDISFEDLEFFAKLKIKYDSLKTVDNTSINVLGFEDSRTNNSPEFLNMTRKEKELWFVNVRDSIVSQKLITYINSRRDENYLVYYGNLHVQKGRVNKSVGDFSLPPDSSYGYCIAEYLTREFGNDNVPVYKGKSYDENPFHVFALAKSRKIFSYSIKLMDKLKDVPKGGYGEIYYKNLLKGISLIAGKNITEITEAEKLLDEGKIFNTEHFDSKEYADYIFNVYSKDVFSEEMRRDFSMMGFGDKFYRYTLVNRADWDKKIWPDALRNIKFLNAVGVTWAGYDDEKKTAREYLISASNQYFSEPWKYLEWWRNVGNSYSR